MNEDILVVIPARGGSKGVPGKNVKMLGGKPLIYYTIELALRLFPAKNICVSTDSLQIKQVVEQTGLTVPFLRPPELATDTANTNGVLMHAVEHYKNLQAEYKNLLLLQPTSPFRCIDDILQMMKLLEEDDKTEMVVSVGVSHHNPYFSLFEEDHEGYLVKSKDGPFSRRQDCPQVFYYNGSAYLMRTSSLAQKSISKFSRIKKYVMEEKYCFDIDTSLDWLICEALLEKGTYNNAHH